MPQVLPTSQKVGVRDGSGRFIDTFDLMIQLPWGALTTVVVHHDMTVLQLKSVIEFSVGLPSDLLTLGYKRHASLADHVTLREMRLIPGDRVNVILEYGFEELVAGAVSGNTQLIVNDIKRHWNEDDVERRRMVVMFIAAHRGFHYLIEKMLTDGAHTDSATPSGRTALHIACAMGNGGCIDTLLQHGANTTLKDANNKTPTQLAFSCGQQEAERRMVLYERARSRQTRRLSKHDEWLLTLPASRGSPSTTKGSLSSTTTKSSSSSSSSWSRSPRFPVSRLARSVTPTLALQELSLSPAPGPELMVKSLGGAMKTKKAVDRWSVRRLTHANLEEFSQSSESSVDSDPGKEEDIPTFDDQESDRTGDDDDNVTVDTIPISSPDDTVSTVTMQSTTPSPRPPPMPSAIRPPHVLPARTAAWQQETRKVRFEDSTKAATTTSKPARARSAPPRRSMNMSSLTLDLDSTQRSLTNGTDLALHSGVGDNEQQYPTSKGTQCNKPIAPPRNKPRAASARLRSPRYNPRYPDDRYGRDEILDMRKFKDIQASLELSVGLRETTDQPLLSNGRRKATPEENNEAFDNWLEGKVQGAKDRKLLNNVQKLLDEAFGRADEEIKRQEEKRPKITGQSFDDWKKQKDEEIRNKKRALLEKQRKQEEARKLQASIDAENELLIKAWVARKNEMERKKKQNEAREKKDKQKRLVEQQIAAQSAFEKWRLNKEWDELVRLREGQDFFDPALKATRESVKRTARKRLSQSSIRSNKKTHLKYGS